MTKKFIIDNNATGLLNNHKWYKIFEWLNDSNINFQLKTLLSDKSNKYVQIIELEETSVLIDNSGDFIEFLEIDRLTIKKTNELLDFLNDLNIDYVDQIADIEIDGYRK